MVFDGVLEQIKSLIEQNIYNIKKIDLTPEQKQYVINQTAFLPETIPFSARLYCLYHKINQHPVCIVCGNKTKWGRLFLVGFNKYCSKTCKNKDPEQQKKCKQGLQKKYGVTNASQLKDIQIKKRYNNLQKYGVEHPSKTLEVKEKIKRTNLERYGVEHPMKKHEFLLKVQKTNLERYGVNYPQQSSEIHAKTKQTNLLKFGRNYRVQTHIPQETLIKLQSREWLYDQHVVQKKSLTQISKDLKLSDMTIVMNYAHRHNVPVQYVCQQSTDELELFQWLSQHVHVVSKDKNIIKPYELDIVVPSHKLAIEFCGLYWHSEQLGKDQNYHKNKLEMCIAQGYRLLTIFEDEWKNSKEIVQEKILNILGLSKQQKVFARNTDIRKVSQREKKSFFEQNHIQGNGHGSITYGLYEKNNLVACMTFINQGAGVFYLNRYATSKKVVGGFSKLLTFFKNNHLWNKIITFADRRWSEGNLYFKCGFIKETTLPPDYYYINNRVRYHKFNMRHSRLRKILPYYDPNLSERINCINAGFLILWDCGKNKFVLTK